MCLARRMVRIELTRVVYHTGSAGDDQNLGGQRQADGVLLARCQADCELLFDPRDGFGSIERGPGDAAGFEAPDLLGDRALGLVQRRQEDARLAVHRVRDDHRVGNFLGDCRLDDVAGDLEQLHCERDQLRVR